MADNLNFYFIYKLQYTSYSMYFSISFVLKYFYARLELGKLSFIFSLLGLSESWTLALFALFKRSPWAGFTGANCRYTLTDQR